MDGDRLTMSLGEAIFTQRSTRKLKPEPIPEADIRLILEAAVKAPNGGNHQTGRFLVVTDRAKIRSSALSTARRGGRSGRTITAGTVPRTSRRMRRATDRPWASPTT
jgi:nitroreductase